MKPSRTLKLCVYFFTLLSLTSTVTAIETANDTPALHQCADVKLKWAMLLSVADVKFFSANCESYGLATQQSFKALEFKFNRAVSASYFKKAANKGFEVNLPSALKDRNETIDINHSFNDHYLAIAKGDVYLIKHMGQEGIVLYKNGRQVIQEKNAVFSHYYFNIWLGDQPAIPKLKGLLFKAFN